MPGTGVFRRASAVGTGRFLQVVSALALALSWSAQAAPGQIQFNQDFDSGSLNVAATTVDMNNPSAPLVTLVGRTNFGPGQWAWVNFQAGGMGGRKPQFRINQTNAFVVFSNNMRWAYSYDGQRWSFFDNGSVSGNYYTCSNNAAFTQDSVYVASYLPYPLSRVEALVSSLKAKPCVFPPASGNADLVIGRTLGTAGGGYLDDYGRTVAAQDIYGFKVTDSAAAGPKKKVVIMCGNHPGETQAAYVLEGLLNFVTGNDPRAVELRRRVEFYVYPNVDPEGRAAGYYRSSPRTPLLNHNRVWDDPVAAGCTEVAVVETAMKADTASRVDYFFDFHGNGSASEFALPGNSAGVKPLPGNVGYINPFTQALVRREPSIIPMTADYTPRYSQGWAVISTGLNATYAFSPETAQLSPTVYGGDIPGRLYGVGRNYGLALYDSLVPEPGVLSLLALVGLSLLRRPRRS